MGFSPLPSAPAVSSHKGSAYLSGRKGAKTRAKTRTKTKHRAGALRQVLVLLLARLH
jgi:hypothetical protein